MVLRAPAGEFPTGAFFLTQFDRVGALLAGKAAPFFSVNLLLLYRNGTSSEARFYKNE
jgi:hypothetical protein